MNDTFPTRFHAKYKRGDSDECWNWIGSKVPGGYGQIKAGGRYGKMLSAHRSAWEIAFGPIPEGLQVLHDCDNPGCVNPNHLTLGTTADNMKDMHQKGRAASQRGSCNGAAKLTEDQVLKIYNAPGIHADIAAEYGMHKSNVSMIKTGRNWGHVTNG